MALTGIIPNATATWEELLALQNEAVGYKVWGLVSHVTFFVQIGLGAHYRNGITVLVSLMALLLSLGYHTCLSFDVCMGLSLESWRRNDHMSAILEAVLVVYYFIRMHDTAVKPRAVAVALEPEEARRLADGHSHDPDLADRDEGDMQGGPPPYDSQWEKIYFFVTVLFAAFVNYNWPLDDFFPFYIVLTTALLGWLIYLVFRLERPPTTDGLLLLAPTVPHWPMVVAFILLGALGVTFFVLPETNSSFFHSWWHFVAPLAVSAAFLAVELDPMEPLYMYWVPDDTTSDAADVG